MATQETKAALLDLIGKWQSFASGLQSIYQGDELSEYHKGIAMGFEAASQELRALVGQFDTAAQAKAAPRKTQEISLQVDPGDTDIEPEWEYFYVTFDQAPDGTWRIKHLNGVWQPGWQTGMDFDDAVQQLSEEGWRLARFANGIHVFRRPRT